MPSSVSYLVFLEEIAFSNHDSNAVPSLVRCLTDSLYELTRALR